MNRNNNKIGWCDYSLNPVVGCSIRCGSWCYARKQAKRFKNQCQACYDFIPHPHLERLDQLSPRQKPAKIFIDSMWDWNDPQVLPEWRETIINKMAECGQHTFQILTKRPEGYAGQWFPPNVWLGTTITGEGDLARVQALKDNTPPETVLFVSYEPMLAPVVYTDWLEGLNWIIMGAETGNQRNKTIPKNAWIEKILYATSNYNNIPVFIKDNINWPHVIKLFPRKVKQGGH